jgi:iron complex transport system substrate-binding protein
MDPSSLDDVLDCVLQVGAATAAEGPAAELVDSLRGRLRAVTDSVAGREKPRTFALEWSDPPFNGGHWVPGMIELAGGEAVLGSPGTPSIRVGWDEIVSASPEVVVFMPCGYDLEAATAEAASLLDRAELRAVGAFFAVDASSYFSRPGPRLVDGVEILASALHPDVAPDSPTPPNAVRRLRKVAEER